MRDILLELINYLIEQGIAKDKDKDIFKDFTPDQPDSCLILREYDSGSTPWYSEATPRFVQIVSRAKKSQEAMATSWQAFNAIKPKEGVADYLGHPCIIQMRTSPIKIKKDEHSRIEYGFNICILTN